MEEGDRNGCVLTIVVLAVAWGAASLLWWRQGGLGQAEKSIEHWVFLFFYWLAVLGAGVILVSILIWLMSGRR